MEFNDRKGNAGTGKGNLVDISHDGIGGKQRAFNRDHLTNTSTIAVHGEYADDASVPGFKGLTVRDAQRMSANGESLPMGGDELRKVQKQNKEAKLRKKLSY